MSDGSNASSGGIGICGLLGVAFVILKLCRVIDWSWWYVTMPFWGPFAIFVLIMIGAGLFAAFTAIVGRK